MEIFHKFIYTSHKAYVCLFTQRLTVTCPSVSSRSCWSFTETTSEFVFRSCHRHKVCSENAGVYFYSLQPQKTENNTAQSSSLHQLLNTPHQPSEQTVTVSLDSAGVLKHPGSDAAGSSLKWTGDSDEACRVIRSLFIQVCVSEVGVPAASQTCSTHEWTDVTWSDRPGPARCWEVLMWFCSVWDTC